MFDRFLLESDEDSLECQAEWFTQLYKEGVVNRLVFSGNKSIHAIVQLSDKPSNAAEYKFAAEMLIRTMSERTGMKLDKNLVTPERLTRHPGGCREIYEGDCDLYSAEQVLLLPDTGTEYFLGWKAVYEVSLMRSEGMPGFYWRTPERLCGKSGLGLDEHYRSINALIHLFQSKAVGTTERGKGNNTHKLLYWAACRCVENSNRGHQSQDVLEDIVFTHLCPGLVHDQATVKEFRQCLKDVGIV
jgi:hypothetical protein